MVLKVLFKKKLPLIIGIIVLLILLIIVLKSLLGTETPTPEINDNPPVEVQENDESILNKKFSIDATKLFNGNILIEINNKNKINVDADVAIDFFDSAGDSLNSDEVSIKNIPAKSIYYESVPVKNELRDLKHEVTAKLKENKYKAYYLDKIEIINKTEEEENLLVEIKNDSYDTIDVVEVYSIFYDSDDNIIGFESSKVNKIAADKNETIKISYPKDKEYNFISFSRYDVGINTAYSYKNY